jgi:hypothetical protein
MVTCVLVGYGTANKLNGNAAGLSGSLIFVISAVGAFAILRPAVYRLYPELKRLDLRRVRRGPNPKTFVALAVWLWSVRVSESVWFGVALISLVAAGALVAAAIAMRNVAKLLLRRIRLRSTRG